MRWNDGTLHYLHFINLYLSLCDIWMNSVGSTQHSRSHTIENTSGDGHAQHIKILMHATPFLFSSFQLESYAFLMFLCVCYLILLANLHESFSEIGITTYICCMNKHVFVKFMLYRIKTTCFNFYSSDILLQVL